MTNFFSRFLFTSFFVITFAFANAQGEANWWYFGSNAGTHFNPAPVSVSGGMVSTTEGVASISDAAGNLLFYTDGVTVYNSLHAVMPNGSGLLGNTSSTQSAIIVQQPGSTTLYYLFTVDLPGNAGGYSYSVIDMTMSGGLGDVTAVKNVLIYSPSTEKITAIRHCNNVDVWIVTHHFGTDEFRTYLLTSTGLSAAPVISNQGVAITSGTQAIGYLKASALGDKLCSVMRYTPSGGSASIIELYDFNNSTGVVSNMQNMGGTYSHAYGCEFSADGRLLYVNCDYKIFQYDLCAGNISQIVASLTQVGTTAVMWIGSLQMGPDSKIYMAGFATPSLGVINNPNVVGMGCNYVDAAISLAPNSANAGLPSFVNYYQPHVPPTINTVMSCLDGNFSYSSATVSCSGGGAPQSVSWNFGDPSSGAANTSLLANPTHTFSAIGNYTLQLIVDFGCFIDTVTTVVIVNNSLTVNVNSPSICVGQTATLTATGAATTYSWSAGATATGVNTATASPVVTTTYTVTGTATGCTGTAIATVSVGASLPVFVTNDTICVGQTATITASGGTTYTWSAGATALGTNSATASPIVTTTYTVTGTSSGCSGTAVSTILVNQIPIVTVNSLTVCSGPVTLTASGATTYSWSAGIVSANADTAVVNPPATTSYTVTGTTSGCSATAVSTVTILGALVVTVSNDTICAGQTATLTANGATTYMWSAGATSATTNTATASPILTTTYTVTGTQGGCTATAISTVVVNAIPVVTVNSPTICGGTSTVLTANGAASYIWSTGATPTGLNTASVSPSTNTTFTVTGTSNGCSNTAIATVTLGVNIQMTTLGDTICSGSSANISASGATSYSWSAGAASTGINTATASPASTTTYTVTGTTFGCTGTATVTVLVYPTPLASFTAPLVVNEIEPLVHFSNQTINALQFDWNFGDFMNPTTNTSTNENPSHTYNQPGVYCVSLIATTNFCIDSTLLCLQIIPEFTFYFPNSFSPNGDGTNDDFYGTGTNIASYEMYIYNRWGELIFHTKEQNKSWKGDVNRSGKIAQEDVYVCIFSVFDTSGLEHKYIGNVTLVN